MRTILAVVTGLLVVTNAGAEPQPGITQIVPRVSQLDVGWNTNQVVALEDPGGSRSFSPGCV